MHLDVRSRNSIGRCLLESHIPLSADVGPVILIGVHFGTFIGAENESLEAVIELNASIEEAGVHPLEHDSDDDKGRFGVVDLGETVVVEIADLVIVD